MEIQEMDCHRLNRLRRVAPVMLHSIRITPERFNQWCILVSWNGRAAVGNPGLFDEFGNVSPSVRHRPAKQRPTSGGRAEVAMGRSVVLRKQGAPNRARR